jgi:hypothetical protein
VWHHDQDRESWFKMGLAESFEAYIDTYLESPRFQQFSTNVLALKLHGLWLSDDMWHCGIPE